MRLFIALNFDKRTKEKILKVQKDLRTIGRGNFTRPENFHLTLVFLGEVEPNKLKLILETMDIMKMLKLELEFSHLGSFRRGNSSLIWLGLKPNQTLIKLQKELNTKLKSKGFDLDNRPYFPHLTLARRFVLDKDVRFDELLEINFVTQIETLSLMHSQRIDGQLIYTEEYRIDSEF